jgi:anti-anti-sigma factor
MPDQPLRIEKFSGSTPGVRILKLDGPLTLGNSFDLQSQVRSDSQNDLIIDMSGVPYIDSTGIGCLVNGYVSHQNAKRKLSLAGVVDRVQMAMKITHVGSLFPTYPSVAEAEKGMGG